MSGETRDILAQLLSKLPSCREICSILQNEIALFQRTMYRNYSQHRRAFFYKDLQHVKRCIRDIPMKQIQSIISNVDKIYMQLQLPQDAHHLSWKTLSSQLKLDIHYTLQLMNVLCGHISTTIRAAQKAYKGLLVQFTQSYFVPFTMFMNSILSRMVALWKSLLVWAIDAHDAIILLYLNEVTKANPLRAKVVAIQLQGYTIPPEHRLFATID